MKLYPIKSDVLQNLLCHTPYIWSFDFHAWIPEITMLEREIYIQLHITNKKRISKEQQMKPAILENIKNGK